MLGKSNTRDYNSSMLGKARSLQKEYETLQQLLIDPKTSENPAELKRIGKRLSRLSEIVPVLSEYLHFQQSIEEAARLRDDPELKALAEEEAEEAKKKIPELEEKIKSFLIPRDEDDDRSVIVEVRAGTGGEEAAHFAAELLRMYIRYAEKRGWKTELMDKSDAEGGGIKEAIIRIPNTGAYGELKFESGVHRVQRVPETEAKGRIHTSAASVAILPEAEEVEIIIKPEDLKIDVYRSSGPGGQSVNTTDSAVRITHIPTNTVVACQDERSQHKNKDKAMRMLKARIAEELQRKAHAEMSAVRATQVGTGDRSERIRTYNFSQNRLTDHRVDLTLYKLDKILEGDLDDIVLPLVNYFYQEKLQS